MGAYRQKEYFTVVRTRKNMRTAPFALCLFSQSSKEKLAQDLSDAGLVPFQNRIMTREEFLRQDDLFYKRVGIIEPEFEADAVKAVVDLSQEKTNENFEKVKSLFDKAKNLGYCEENEIYTRLQKAIVMA